MNEIAHCEVCGNNHLRPVLNLGAHPMCDDLVRVGDSRECNLYPIEILFCDTCGTAHQRFQVPKDDLFPPTYHYRSRQTADVLSGMRDLVEAVERDVGSLRSKKVLDIGCNDGSLLSIFKERGAETFGIEPTGAADDASKRGHVTVKAFLTPAIAAEFVGANGNPDVITFTNVFAHIEDLPSVICAVATLKSPDTVLVVENHYLGAIIERHQFDTFYHEHPRTYSFRSFARIAESLGMRVSQLQFPQRYGGNIRVFMRTAKPAESGRDRYAEIEAGEDSHGSDLVELSSQIERWRKAKRESLNVEFKQHGKLRAKAFPGRAAIPIKLLGLDEKMISAVYEKPGSAKIGHYVPGTRIPIRSDDEIDTSEQSAPMLNLAWHIRGEIESYLRNLGFRARIIDIISQEDFSGKSSKH